MVFEKTFNRHAGEPGAGSLFPAASATAKTPAVRRSLVDFLAPLEEVAAQSSSLVAYHDARFMSGSETYELPHYVYVGSQGGDTPIHIGVFAGFHGNKLESANAVIEFIKLLEATPDLARGYCLSFYPICNPTGFEDGTRFPRHGKDLSHEFWKNSSEPEVWLLQAELLSRSFQGIVLLHTDDVSHGSYGCSGGVTLSKHLLRQGHPIENTEAIFSAPLKARSRPFEIIYRTPASLPSYMNEIAFINALQTVLIEYREFIAHARNL